MNQTILGTSNIVRFAKNILLTLKGIGETLNGEMTKTNLILAGVIAAGLLIGVALGGYKDASAAAVSA